MDKQHSSNLPACLAAGLKPTRMKPNQLSVTALSGLLNAGRTIKLADVVVANKIETVERANAMPGLGARSRGQTRTAQATAA